MSQDPKSPSDAADFYEDDFVEEDEMDSDAAFLEFVCGMGPDGQCSLAGSEDCDWECPRSRE